MGCIVINSLTFNKEDHIKKEPRGRIPRLFFPNWKEVVRATSSPCIGSIA